MQGGSGTLADDAVPTPLSLSEPNTKGGMPMKLVRGFVALTLILVSAGCARLVAPQAFAFRGNSEVRPCEPLPAVITGGGTVGVAGGLLIDELNKNCAQQR